MPGPSTSSSPVRCCASCACARTRPSSPSCGRPARRSTASTPGSASGSGPVAPRPTSLPTSPRRSSRRATPQRSSSSSAPAPTARARTTPSATASSRTATSSSSTSVGRCPPATAPTARGRMPSGRLASPTWPSAYAALQAAQQASVEAVRPGVTCEAIDRAARDVLAEAGLAERFIHRTGHGIGLDGHEEPYIVAGNDLPVEPGMTFSIEPGVYLAGPVGCSHRGHRRRDRRRRRALQHPPDRPRHPLTAPAPRPGSGVEADADPVERAQPQVAPAGAVLGGER